MRQLWLATLAASIFALAALARAQESFSIAGPQALSLFYRDARIAALATLPSGGKDGTVRFSFAAGGGLAEIAFDGEPGLKAAALKKSGDGVALDLSSARSSIHLSSVRLAGQSAWAPESSGVLAWKRGELALSLLPGKGSRVDGVDGVYLVVGSSAGVRFTLTASAGLPPVQPLAKDSILTDKARACAAKTPRLAEAARVLEFLSWRDRLLSSPASEAPASERETLAALRVLAPVAHPDLLEAGLRSVLDRVSPKGDAAGGEYLLPLVVEAYLAKAANPRLRAFFADKTAAGGTYAEAYARTVSRLVEVAKPYAEARAASRLASVDGRFELEVNVGLIPASLRAAPKTLTRLAAFEIPPARRVLDELGEAPAFEKLAFAWDHSWEHFRVSVPLVGLRERLKRFVEASPERGMLEAVDLGGATVRQFVDGKKTPKELERGLAFWSPSLDSEGRPSLVMPASAGAVLETRDVAPAAAEDAARAVGLPSPLGLARTGGLMAANTVFSPKPEAAVRADAAIAILAARGAARQLADLPKKHPRRAVLERASAAAKAKRAEPPAEASLNRAAELAECGL
ncbi:MAG: hypothetical protein HY925_07165 [Elusimicrobia bacterium]|nr:hypothetical protein [Elusimicrobiota bacterium]